MEDKQFLNQPHLYDIYASMFECSGWLEAWKIYIIVPSLEKSRAFFWDHQYLIIPFSLCPEANEVLNLISACYKHCVVGPSWMPFPGCNFHISYSSYCFSFLYHVWKNIELKVEVETLKWELQEREQLLIKASWVSATLSQVCKLPRGPDGGCQVGQ